MATINPVGQWVTKGVHKTTWSNMLNSGDTVGAQSAPGLADKTVYVSGTFASAVVAFDGSNNTATGPYYPLLDPQGNTISLSSATGVETVLENTLFVRPRISGATATNSTDITVIMISRGNLR